MAFDSLGRYTTSHKVWDHVGNMIPVVEASEGQRPHGEFKPAAWLPVQFFDKHFEEWFTIMPGKLVACDNDGRLVPAQYGLTGASITYTADDVTAGVIDVRTGSALLTANIGTFTVAAVTAFLGQTGVALSISAPIGVAPYPYWQWAGDGSAADDGYNPAGFRQHNHSLQHQTAVLCDYVLELPLVPAVVAAAENLAYASYASHRVTFAAVSNLPVAKNTVRTPITFANGTKTNAGVAFVSEVENATDVTQLGEWHINVETGVVTSYAASDPGAGNLYTITYYHYASAPTSVSKFASAVGNLTAGSFVKCDSNSNFVVADPVGTGRGTANFQGADQFDQIMGQVIEVEDIYDKDYLGRVRTAYNPAIGTDATGSLPGYTGQMDQMPGSATGGVTDKVHYAGAANLVVRINLISR